MRHTSSLLASYIAIETTTPYNPANFNMSDEEANKPLSKNLEEAQQPVVHQINFEYIKSNSFRVVHVDGAWGGITPNFNIQMAVFSERPPIPKSITLEFADDELPKEIMEKRVGRNAVIREVEASLVMDLSTARAINKWLGDHVNELENAIKKTIDQEKEAK